MALSVKLLSGWVCGGWLEDFRCHMCDTVLFEDIEKP